LKLDFEVPEGTAATIAVGTVTELAPGDAPTITNSGTSAAATFDFGIPAASIAALQNDTQPISVTDGAFSGTVTQAPGSGANNQGPALQTADAFDDWVPAGLLGSVPSPASLTCDLPAGRAVVLGQRTVLQAAVANTYPTSSDTYVDFSYNGLLTYSSVANGASAPAVATDSLRLEKVVTSATAITAVTQMARTAPDVTLGTITTNGPLSVEGGISVGLGPGGINTNLRVGYQTLYSNTTGNYLLALGAQSFFYNTTGSENTGVGQGTGYNNTTGDGNTYIGTAAGAYGVTSSNCTFVGAGAAQSAGNAAQYCQIIGQGSQPSGNNAVHETVIGAQLTGKGSNTAFIGGTAGAYMQGPVIAPNLQATGFTTLAGTTAGNIQWQQYLQGAFKAFAAQALGYENDTATNQTITFPTPFANTPVITQNTTGLTVSATTTTLTITAPNATTLFTGIIKVEGF
jgi:hypothetical protein